VDNAVAAYRDEQEYYLTYLKGLDMRALLRERPELLDGPELGACMDSVIDWQNRWDSDSGVGTEDYEEGLASLLVGCRLHRTVGGQAERLSIGGGDPTPNHTRLADALAQYANALAVLSNSTGDREAFQEAAENAKDNILELLAAARDTGEKLGVSSPLDIDEELGVIGSALIDGVGAALEARRREALGRVVKATHPAVKETATHLAAITRFYHLAAVPKLTSDYEAAVDETGRTDVRASETLYSQTLERATAAQERLIAYARTDPGAVYERMVEAHEALRLKLEDPGVRLGELAGSVQDFHKISMDVLDAIRSARIKAEGGGT
jgi:hypothetical protein